MYLQTLHWRPLVNGYSAVLPPSYREVARWCRPFPDASGLARLSEMGVTHVVLHRRTPEWQPGLDPRARVFRFLPAFEGALREAGTVPVFSDGSTEVYRLEPRPASSRSTAPPGIM